MGRRKKEATEQQEQVTSAVDNLIEEATAGEQQQEESHSEPESVAREAATDALDSARELETPSNLTVESGSAETRKRRRRSDAGRPRGNSVSVDDNADLPRTKRGALEALAAARAERDAARGEVSKLAAKNHEDAVNQLAMSIAVAGDLACTFMASRRGSHWKLAEDESKTFGNAWATCLAPYAETLAKAVPWVIAVGVTAGLFKTRIDIDAENVKRLEEEERARKEREERAA